MAAYGVLLKGKDIPKMGFWKSFWMSVLVLAGVCTLFARTTAAYSDFEESNEDEWRPVFHEFAAPHSPRRYPLFSQVYPVPPTPLRPTASKKAYLQVLSNSNKVESYSPPSILGPLSDFGHSTVKAKRPIVFNKTSNGIGFDTPSPTQNQPIKVPARYENFGYSAHLLPPPVHPTAAPYRTNSEEIESQEQYQSFRDAALLLKTVRPPPHTDQNYRFGSPAGAPSQNPFFYSYNFPQSQGLGSYHSPNKDNPKGQATNYSPFLAGGQSIYGPPSPVYPVVLRPSIPSFHHHTIGEPYVLRPQPHVKNTEEAVLKRRPVTLYSGDINGNKNLLSPEILGNSKRLENTEAPLTPTKSPGKQVFEQLSHFARPFQTSSHREKEEDNNQIIPHPKPFVANHQFSVPNQQKLNWNNGGKQKVKGQLFELGALGANSAQPNHYEGEKIYGSTQSQPSSLHPYTGSTVDVSASPESVTIVPYTDSLVKDNFRPNHYFYQSTSPRPLENHKYSYNKNAVLSTTPPSVNVVSEEDEYATFLPTPTSDARPFTFNSGNGQPVSGFKLENTFQRPKTNHIQENQDGITESDKVTKSPEVYRRRRPTVATKAPVQFVEEQYAPPITEAAQTDYQDTAAPPTTVTQTVSTTTPRSRRRRPTHRQRVKPSQEEIPSVNFNQEVSNSDFNGQNIFTQFVDYTTTTPDSYSNNNDNINHNSYNKNQNQAVDNYSQNNANNGNTEESSENYPINIRFSENDSQTTTTTSSPASTSAPTRTRNRFRYGNNTRPRFSVKDYKEKLKSTTLAPETNENNDSNDRKEILKTRFSNRNKSAYKPETSKNTTESETKQDAVVNKYKPRIRPSRYRPSSTTTPDVLTTTTTERVPFKPSSSPGRYKNGVSKYYSRYRTSTEAPSTNASADIPSSSSTRNPVKLKGVFSAKRRPFPLKTGASQKEESEDKNENDDDSTVNNARPDEALLNENEVAPEVTKKVDNFITSSAVLKGEESLLSPEIATKPLDDVSMEYEDDDGDSIAATKVADLTSSSSNLQKQPIQNEVSSSNRRTLPRITIATDDPILPIEAFFQSSRPNKNDRIHR